MKTINCNAIGNLKQNENFHDWWESDLIAIPFFNNKKLKVTFRDFDPDYDLTFLKEASDAFNIFLSKKSEDKLLLSKEVFANYKGFIDDVEPDWLEGAINNVTNPIDIWNFIKAKEIYIVRRHRRDHEIYLEVSCSCNWEEEHGLQLVFKKGLQLTRVSGHDGHITDADAYNIPDSEDKLLSLYKENTHI